jgi:type IV secretory pathway VirB2 component (pilin)
MEWTTGMSFVLVFLLGPLALAVGVMALVFVGRVVLRGRAWERLGGWCEGCVAGCGRCCGLSQ